MSAEIHGGPRSRAILIGTSVYDDPRFPPLPAVVNSLNGMHEVLTDPRLCSWPAGSVEVWRDPSDVRRLVVDLRRLARQITDVLLVYFAGHGTITPQGQLCMALTDTVFTDADVTGLRFEHVRQALLESPARTKILILDCCYAGRVIEALSGHVADGTAIRGAYTLTASDQEAHVVPPDQQVYSATSFTGEFLDLIRSGVHGGPEWLTMHDLYPHLQHRLARRGLPAPNQRGTDTADRYPFVRNAAFGMRPLPLESPLEPERGLSVEGRPRGHVPTSPGEPSPGGTKEDKSSFKWRSILIGGLVAAAMVGLAVLIVIIVLPPLSGSTEHAPRSSPVTPTADRNVLTGHAGEVNSVAFSPDGKTLASGGADGGIRLWEVASRRTTATLDGHAGAVHSVAFSPDWKTLASGGADGSVRLWEVASGRNIATLGGHAGAVHSVEFSPSGGLLASGGIDHTARLWEVASKKAIATLTDRPAAVNAVSFGPDGSVLLTAYADDCVRFWDVHARKKMGLLTVNEINSVNALAVARPGRTEAKSGLIVLGNSPGGVTLWDGNGKGRQYAPPVHTDSPVNAVAFHPKARTLAIGASDGTIRLWDTRTREFVGRPFVGHAGGITSLAFSPDGSLLASGSVDKTIRIWEL